MPKRPMTEEERKLVEDNIRLAYDLSYRIARTNGNLDREDVFQIAALGLCKAAMTYDPNHNPDSPLSFAGWAWIVMFNEVRMYLRWRKRQLDVHPVVTPLGMGDLYTQDDDSIRLHALVQADDDPAEEALDHLERLDVLKLLEQLPPDQRAILRLYCSGMTQRDLAALAAKSQSWASRKIRKAIQAIRQLVVEPDLAAPALRCPADTAHQPPSSSRSCDTHAAVR